MEQIEALNRAIFLKVNAGPGTATWLINSADQLWLRQRAIIETINDPIKNIQQVEHTRHRSLVHAMVNELAALVAYTHQPRKPSLNLSQNELKLLTGQE